MRWFIAPISAPVRELLIKLRMTVLWFTAYISRSGSAVRIRRSRSPVRWTTLARLRIYPSYLEATPSGHPALHMRDCHWHFFFLTEKVWTGFTIRPREGLRKLLSSYAGARNVLLVHTYSLLRDILERWVVACKGEGLDDFPNADASWRKVKLLFRIYAPSGTLHVIYFSRECTCTCSPCPLGPNTNINTKNTRLGRSKSKTTKNTYVLSDFEC